MFDSRIDQLVFDFNCRPLGYVDPSWLEPQERVAATLLSGSESAQAVGLINERLLGRLGLADAPAFDFMQVGKRLMLVDASVFQTAAFWLGIDAISHLLRQWIDPPRRLVLRDALSNDGMVFFSRHILPHPQVARFSFASQLVADCSSQHLQALARRCGAALLLSACGSLGDVGVRRAALKLPRQAVRLNRCKPMSPLRAQRVIDFAVHRYIGHKEPSWHWLF
jgi:hypothetical protein